jgi:uncharacterized protein YdeI (YjbR/CyaY-like superfamily)
VERYTDGREIVEVSNRAAWRRWLAKRHKQRDAIWLVFHKKTSDGTSPSYEEAVEEALCFGWIDSTVNRLDERRTLQLFAPRKPRSTWSASNKERVARLEREGLLAPAGIAAIEVAKENGSWSALDAVERLEEPPELAAALDADAAARENWNGFSPSSRKGTRSPFAAMRTVCSIRLARGWAIGRSFVRVARGLPAWVVPADPVRVHSSRQRDVHCQPLECNDVDRRVGRRHERDVAADLPERRHCGARALRPA